MIKIKENFFDLLVQAKFWVKYKYYIINDVMNNTLIPRLHLRETLLLKRLCFYMDD